MKSIGILLWNNKQAKFVFVLWKDLPTDDAATQH